MVTNLQRSYLGVGELRPLLDLPEGFHEVLLQAGLAVLRAAAARLFLRPLGALGLPLPQSNGPLPILGGQQELVGQSTSLPTQGVQQGRLLLLHVTGTHTHTENKSFYIKTQCVRLSIFQFVSGRWKNAHSNWLQLCDVVYVNG